MTQQMLNILCGIVEVVIVAIAAYFTPRFLELIETKIGKDNTEKLKDLIDSFVKAAEQMYGKTPGKTRKDYVVGCLNSLGIDVDDTVDALIEAAVYALPPTHGEGENSDNAD